METNPYADYNQLLDALAVPLTQKLTGTFFIATDDNGSCRFAIVDGKITHCRYKRLQGKEAILNIQKSLRGRAAFSENNATLFKGEDRVEHEFVVGHLGITLTEPTPEQPEDAPEEVTVLTSNTTEPTADSDAPDEKPNYLKRTYRGQEVLVEAPKEDSEKSQAPKKPPRMYRGQILDD